MKTRCCALDKTRKNGRPKTYSCEHFTTWAALFAFSIISRKRCLARCNSHFVLKIISSHCSMSRPILRHFCCFGYCSVCDPFAHAPLKELGGGNVWMPQKYTSSQQELTPRILHLLHQRMYFAPVPPVRILEVIRIRNEFFETQV